MVVAHEKGLVWPETVNTIGLFCAGRRFAHFSRSANGVLEGAGMELMLGQHVARGTRPGHEMVNTCSRMHSK